jgi:hypothetical protein
MPSIEGYGPLMRSRLVVGAFRPFLSPQLPWLRLCMLQANDRAFKAIQSSFKGKSKYNPPPNKCSREAFPTNSDEGRCWRNFEKKKTKKTEQSRTRAFLRTGRERLPLDTSMLVCGSVLAAPNQSTHVYTTHSNPIQSIHSDSAQLLSPSSVTRQSINPDQTTYNLDLSADLSNYNCVARFTRSPSAPPQNQTLK